MDWDDCKKSQSGFGDLRKIDQINQMISLTVSSVLKIVLIIFYLIIKLKLKDDSITTKNIFVKKFTTQYGNVMKWM